MRTKGNTIYPKRRILFSKSGCPLPVRSNFAVAKLVISAAVTRRRSGVCTINPCLSLSMYVILLRMCVMDSSGTGIGLFSIIAASDFRGETLMRSVSSLSIRFIASLGRSEERGIVRGRCRWAYLAGNLKARRQFFFTFFFSGNRFERTICKNCACFEKIMTPK